MICFFDLISAGILTNIQNIIVIFICIELLYPKMIEIATENRSLKNISGPHSVPDQIIITIN